mgnify:CR=1 FL=1
MYIFEEKTKLTLAVSTCLLLLIKSVTFRVQTAPFDKRTIDFWRSRKHLHVSDLLKAKKSKAKSISFGLKSPSGPIKIKVFSVLLTIFRSNFSPSSQWARYLVPSKPCFKKSFKVNG